MSPFTAYEIFPLDFLQCHWGTFHEESALFFSPCSPTFIMSKLLWVRSLALSIYITLSWIINDQATGSKFTQRAVFVPDMLWKRPGVGWASQWQGAIHTLSPCWNTPLFTFFHATRLPAKSQLPGQDLAQSSTTCSVRPTFKTSLSKSVHNQRMCNVEK